MRDYAGFAQVIVDIPTMTLEHAFTYGVPSDLAGEVRVGSCVVVPFGSRFVLGYVIEVVDGYDAAGVQTTVNTNTTTGERVTANTKIKPIAEVLSAAYFSERAVRTAFWIAEHYLCPISEALKLFLPPQARFKVARSASTASGYQVSRPKVGAVDDRWAHLAVDADEALSGVRQNASRQRALINALREGPVRVSELALGILSVRSALSSLEKKGVVTVERVRRIRDVATVNLSSATAQKRRYEELTSGQQQALDVIDQALQENIHETILIDGVTGSGKTEVYLAAIEKTLERGKDALVLVPEISLTPQTVGRFRSRFGDTVAVLHSRLSAGERFDQWDLIDQGQARVVVGPRSALFAPVKNLGLIVIDEEHETTYKQGSSPRYHARQVARFMGELEGVPVVLGSATPSIEILHDQSATRVSMPERATKAALASVTIVDMKQEFTDGHRSMFSRALLAGLERVIERKQKAVLMLNRRGFANFMLCRECDYVPRCEHCSTSLTLHVKEGVLKCHSCDYTTPIPAVCPRCGSRYLRQFGAGTQRVEEELAQYIPNDVPIIRMDADTTRAKNAHGALLEAFDQASCAILLGTQMIAKGLDFPEVTLVGVLNADTALKFPDFRAAERAYALLEQVAGRSGRGSLPGEVIIQVYQSDHPAIQAVASHDRATFIDYEINEREEFYNPPFCRYSRVVLWSRDQVLAKHAAQALATRARALATQYDQVLQSGKPEVMVQGPSSCIIEKLKDDYRFMIAFKSAPDFAIGRFIQDVMRSTKLPAKVSCSVDIDAYDVM